MATERDKNSGTDGTVKTTYTMPPLHENIEPLISMLEKTGKNYNIEKIKAAYEYASNLHAGQKRQSGEPYITHPIAVAEIVASLELDTDSICAALLHDTVEDCAERTNLEFIKSKFGNDVAMLVDGLTKLVQLQVADKEEAHIENLRKMLLAMSKDIRVIFIKLCDRLHNMRTLAAKPDERRRAIALETMYVYAPLAHRLGIQLIKQELENLSLSYLDPIGYEEVRANIESKYGQSRSFFDEAKKSIEEKLRDNNIHFTLEGRVKSIYSLYNKMYNHNKSFDQIYDFYALRIIVETELECYTALGIIHEMFRSVPGRFKDYISTPKPNMYRSLHTTVMSGSGVPFEVQIRTYEMHQIAEFGIAAHWKYKSGEESKEEIDEKLSWIAKLLDAENDTSDPDEFMHAFKIDIFHDETFIFTPKGDVIVLPQGSTVIDFAYAIHSEVGNKMVGAKINGMIVPIDRVPQTGEIVDILTSSASKGPSRDWLSIVKTGEARTKIRQWFKKEKKTENIVVGKDEIERELRRTGRSYTDAQRDEIVQNVAKRIGMNSAEDLYNMLGYGGTSISKISAKLRDEFDRVIKADDEPVYIEAHNVKVSRPKNLKVSGGVVVDGESGCMIKFAKCCNPLPGDDIIGFITRGYGVSIHKRDCPNVKSGIENPEQCDRWLDASWENISDDEKSGDGIYEALISITAEDKMSLVADITAALAEMKVSLLQINTKKLNDGTVIVNLTIGCKNISHYTSIVSKLRALSGIITVMRGFA